MLESRGKLEGLSSAKGIREFTEIVDAICESESSHEPK
jgi:hypothetical protein